MKELAAATKIPPSVGYKNAALTTRERQIIGVLAKGLTNKEIGRRLRVAEGTVKVHLHRIYRKLGIANRTALVVLALTSSRIAKDSSPVQERRSARD